MIAPNRLLITRRHPACTRALTPTLPPTPTLLLLFSLPLRHHTLTRRSITPSLRLLPLAPLLLLLRRSNIIIRHRASPLSSLSTIVNAFIVGAPVTIAGFGVFGNNVPGVQKTGDVAQDAEADVDEGVGAAEAAFDPDYEMGGLVL